MPNLSVKGGAKRATLHAVVTRADGSVEELGVIAYHHRNPFKRWIVNFFIALRRRFTG